MKKHAFALLVCCLVFLSGRSHASAFDGPFQVKNQFPLFLPVNQPYLEPAATGDSLSFSVSHSSVYMIEDADRWSARLDMELTELNLRFRRDIPGLFELGVDLPVLRATGGFLDRPLAWYHRTFGFGDYGRSERPDNDFVYAVDKDGAPLIRADNGRTGLGDIRTTVKKKIFLAETVVSILADVELPTGNARVGYGNGSVDAGLALLLDRGLTDEARLYANVGVVMPGKLKAYQTVDLETFYYGGAAVEYRYDPDLTLLAQVMAASSPYPETGISEIDTPGILLVLGGRYYLGRGSLEFSLTEDPNTSGAPDFILNLTWKQRL
ncbi:MAG: hypothetical protein A2010_16155 [Nitrospirae bacterium GWD2_57_9]|nr:MAG: hypothetical protein A2010_16155 [Nitrospirae bacterium GWD2_57_9]OGW48652.1 MAG: hypothetical protein A2078_13090 [Nitrospirae bacterium GWC2_57_9]